LYTSPNTKINKPGKIMWERYIELIRNACTALSRKLTSMRTLVKCKQRREDDVKIGTDVTGRMWISRQALVNTVINLTKSREFPDSATISFSRRKLHYKAG
jgi:hypothetical protein